MRWGGSGTPDHYSSVWKHSEAGSSGTVAGPSPSRARGHECPPQHDQQQDHFSPACTLLARGKLSLVASRISPNLCTPSTDWEVFNPRTGDPRFCTPSGPCRILSGPFSAVALGLGRSGSGGRGTKANSPFCLSSDPASSFKTRWDSLVKQAHSEAKGVPCHCSL